MTWEDRLEALQTLTDVSLRMRSPGDWYVHAVGMGIAGDGFIRGAYGNGATPEAAVNNHWQEYASLTGHAYIVIEGHTGRKQYRWHKYRWIDWMEVANGDNS